MSDKTPLEDEIDRLVDSVPMLPPDEPELNAQVLAQFIEDHGAKIDEVEDIRKRYGFPTGDSMLEFMRRRPEVMRRIKERRTLREGTASAPERARERAGIILDETIHIAGAIILNPSTPVPQKLDAFKTVAKIAGADGGSSTVKDGGGAGGKPFALQIVFSGAPPKTISGVAIEEAAELPAPDVGQDEDPADEDV